MSSKGLECQPRALFGDDQPLLFRVRSQVSQTHVTLRLRMQETLLPTLAVCGRPQNHDFDFLKEHEPFDHGFYAGPFGVCNVKPGT